MTDHVIQRYRLMETQVVGVSAESARQFAATWSTKPSMAMGLDPDEDGVPAIVFVNGVAFRRAERGGEGQDERD